MGVLLIRCLESELYVTIVALSTILDRAISHTSFDAICAVTFPTDQFYGASHNAR